MKTKNERSLIDFLISFKFKLLETFIEIGTIKMTKDQIINTFFTICDALKASDKEMSITGDLIFGERAKEIIEEHNKKVVQLTDFIQPVPTVDTAKKEENDSTLLTGQNDVISFSERKEQIPDTGEVKGSAKRYSSAPYHASGNKEAA